MVITHFHLIDYNTSVFSLNVWLARPIIRLANAHKKASIIISFFSHSSTNEYTNRYIWIIYLMVLCMIMMNTVLFNKAFHGRKTVRDLESSVMHS